MHQVVPFPAAASTATEETENQASAAAVSRLGHGAMDRHWIGGVVEFDA